MLFALQRAKSHQRLHLSDCISTLKREQYKKKKNLGCERGTH